MTDNTTISFQQRIESAYQNRDYKVLREIFRTHEVVDIADVFADFPLGECIVLFRLVPRLRRAILFSYLPLGRQEDLLEELPDVVVSAIVNNMEPDDRTKLLEDLPDLIRGKILSILDPAERSIAWRLLSYPEDSVGRLMTPDFVALRSDMGVSQALEYIRWSSVAPIDSLHHLFVTEGSGKLVGEIGLATIVVTDPPTRQLSELMNHSSVFLHPEQASTDAVEAFRKYDRPQIPVVDDDQTIIGIVTADDVFDVAEEEATEDIQQFGGHAALEESYFQTPAFTMLKKRAGWLGVLFLGMTFTGTALRHYDEVLVEMGYLVFFLPLIISSGGNSGTQAASLILRGLAINEMGPGDWVRVLKREVIMGLALGSILGVLGFSRAVGWGYGQSVGITVALTLVSVVLFGAVAGSMLPFAFKKTKVDPAVISSPFIATLVDIMGIIMFINIAIFTLKYFSDSP